MKKILITSVGTATAVNLIKGFKRLGSVTLYGTDINPFGYTAGSQMVDGYFKVPLATDPSYLPVVQNIIKDEQIDFFLPINDSEVELISKNKDAIPCKTFLADYETISLTRDKRRCNDLVRSLGIPVAKDVSIDTPCKKVVRNICGVGSTGVWFYEPEETVSFDSSTQICQEFISGEEYTVDLLCDATGIPAYIIPRKRLQVKAGVATKILVEDVPTLVDSCKKITEKLCLPGFSNIQFIKDEKGDFYFIEINARFSGAGAATLLAAKDYLKTYQNFIEGASSSGSLNKDVSWNAVITRYYEEVMYLEH